MRVRHRGVSFRRHDASDHETRRDGAGRGVTFYRLIESAKLAGVDPKAYLLKAVHAAIADPKAVTLPADLLA